MNQPRHHAVVPFLLSVVFLSGASVVAGQDEASPSPIAVEGKRPTEAADTPTWTPIFNGRDLEGWVYKETGSELGVDPSSTVKVEDGVIRMDYGTWESFKGRFGHLFYRVPHDRYRIRVVYRFTGEQVNGGPGWAFRNSGIMVHGQTPESMTKDQKFPVSIEVQLLGGNGKADRTNSNLCTPGTNVVMDGKLVTRHCSSSTSKTYHGDQWVTAEVEVRGGKVIRHILEGKTVLEYDEPQLDPKDAEAKLLIKDGQLLLTGGTISLQSESHPVQFRKVELLELK